MLKNKFFLVFALALTSFSVPSISLADPEAAKQKAEKANVCQGEMTAPESPGEMMSASLNNNYNATSAGQVGFTERGGQIGELKTKMEKEIKQIKKDHPDYTSDPVAKRAVKDLEKCIQSADEAGKTADKQAEDAKKSNEEKGGGGGMPDLSSLMSALQKEKKEEEKKELPLDCSNPESSSNPVCICQVNPRGIGCGSKEEQSSSVAKKERTSKSDSSPESTNSPLGSNFSNERTPSKTTANGLPAGGGGSGGGGAGSGSAGARSGHDNTLGAPYAKPTSVIDGTYGGGGGGRSASGSAFRSDTPLGRSAARIQRSLASVGRTGGSKDGLTGPHTDLFRKVRTRYMSVRGSLNP